MEKNRDCHGPICLKYSSYYLKNRIFVNKNRTQKKKKSMKKNGLIVHLNNGLRQKLLMMKLTVFFLMVTFLQVSAGGYSQNISISLKNVPVEKLFKEIEKQSEYRFFYNEKLIKNATTITIHVKDVSVETVLQKCILLLLHS